MPSLKKFKRILASVDSRPDQSKFLDLVVNVAQANDAAVKFVEVVPEPTWGAWLAFKNWEHVQQLIEKEKAERLRDVAARARDHGVRDVTTEVLSGAKSIALVREVLRNDHDLVIHVTKGPESRRRTFLGTTATRLLRKCPCPLWLASPDAAGWPQNMVACVETSSNHEEDRKLNGTIVDLAAALMSVQSAKVSIVHAWSIWNESMIKSHMSEGDFEAFEASAARHARTEMQDFLAEHPDLQIAADDAHLLKGEPGDVIPEFVEKLHADLVIMGTVARGGVSGIIMGNTAEQILSKISCSILAIKPESFVTPVKL